MTLTTQEAGRILAEVVAEAVSRGKNVSVAIVDRSGDTLLAQRHDAQRVLNLQLATAKAYTAAVMERPTLLLEGWKHGGPSHLQTISALSGHTMMYGHGGYTIANAEGILGGLGVSGAKGDVDQLICERVLERLGYRTDFVLDF